MKSFCLSLLVSIFLALPVFAADVNGLWKFGGNNQTMIFFQEKEKIKVMCTYRSGDKVITWFGQGSIDGNRIKYNLHHANTDDKNLDEHLFTVAQDGKSMSGTWGKVGQVKGNWTLEKIGP